MDTDFGRLLGLHQGAFTRDEALAAGFSVPQLRRRLGRGEWRALHRNVYAVNSGPLPPLRQLAGDLLHAGPLAAASHLSAARLHGIDTGGAGDGRHVTVPVSVVVAKRPGLVVTRSRQLVTPHHTRQGLPCLSVARTVVDLAQVLDRKHLTESVADVVRRTDLTVDALAAAAEGWGGRAGIALLRQVLEEFDPLHESSLETELHPLLVAGGWTDLVPQYEVWDQGVLVARLDFADPESREGFEADGWAFHSSPVSLARDRRRDTALRRIGWGVTRFLTGQIRGDRAAVVGEASEVRRLSALQARRAS